MFITAREVTVGIDASLTGTAAVMLEGNEYYRQMLVDTKKVDGVERLIQIRDKVELMLSEEEVVLVALENYSYASHFKAHQLGELGGLLRELMYNYKYPLLLVSPQQNKKFFTGKGTATKEAMLAKAEELGFPLPKKGKKDDLADAFSLALLGRAYYKLSTNGRPKLEDYQRTVIEDLITNKGTYADLIKYPNGVKVKKPKKTRKKVG